MLKNAKWIKSPQDMVMATAEFRKSFSVKKDVKSATLYASAAGIYCPKLNGKKVTDAVLMPGLTSYKTRVLYQEYDVTDLICESNELSIGVGPGWAVGYYGYSRERQIFFDEIATIARLHIVYSDGGEEDIITDSSFEVFTTPVTSSDIYKGETVDLTAEITKLGAAIETTVNTTLVPQDGEWIKEIDRLNAIEIIKTPKGEYVIDFGQNMTGYVEVTVKGNPGDRIVLHHGEVLDKDGNFYLENMRSAKNENVFILSGGNDVFKPTYSFQGFRYVHLVECPDYLIDKKNFKAIAVHSDMKRTGRFVCGNEKINQLYHNIVWGQKSNFLDIPTDCPQRDERLGWTGDAQVFCRTASINYDTEKFFTKWLSDVAIEQLESGAVTGIIPQVHKGTKGVTRISAAWGDVACVIPWELFLTYGSKELLKKNFPMMKKWVEYMHSVGPEEYLWLTGFHYGDWLAMDAGADSYVGATSNDLIASAFFAYSTSLLIKAGEVLGEDMTEYRELYKNVRATFREYFMENGMPKAEFPITEILPRNHAPVDTVRLGMTQTSLVLILHFGLCDENERPALENKLCEMIAENGNRMTTGFVGTPYILHVLTKAGKTDLAYKLLFQEKNPSWLYSVTHGATTMWEHWNSLKEDGSFWSTDMNSFNHYAYGAVYDWIFSTVIGISPVASAPAYREVTIAPHPCRELGFAKASIESRSGKITSHWYYKGDKVYYEIEIPEGVTAHITLPSGYTETVGAGNYVFVD